MKKIILSIILFAVVVTGCRDFLQEDVRGVISPDNFYHSDIEAKQAANGLYDTFHSRSLYGDWQGINTFTYFGADVIATNRPFGGNSAITNYTMTESNYANAYSVWQELFRVVGDANSVLSNIISNSDLSKETVSTTTGEALFMRAFAYYHLTVLWDDVPYFRDDLTLGEISVLGRSSSETIRSEMVADLSKIENEALLPSDISSSSDQGRVTIWAAKALKARYMLWQKDWIGALNSAKDIIANSPHDLLSNFEDVFSLDNNMYNNEIIWALDYTKDLAGSTRTDSFNPRLRDEPKNSEDRSALSSALSERGEEFNGYGLAVPLPSIYDQMPSDDLRKPFTALNNYLGFELRYFYSPKLWNLDFTNSPRGNHGEIRTIFRMADIYLIAAEAENELNGPANAYQYINAVRARAFEPDQPLSGLSYEEFSKALRDERKWELAGEDDRRYDLIRWGILVETVRNTEYPAHAASTNIKNHHVLLPIPEQEIELNPALLESDPTNNGYRSQ